MNWDSLFDECIMFHYLSYFFLIFNSVLNKAHKVFCRHNLAPICCTAAEIDSPENESHFIISSCFNHRHGATISLNRSQTNLTISVNGNLSGFWMRERGSWLFSENRGYSLSRICLFFYIQNINKFEQFWTKFSGLTVVMQNYKFLLNAECVKLKLSGRFSAAVLLAGGEPFDTQLERQWNGFFNVLWNSDYHLLKLFLVRLRGVNGILLVAAVTVVHVQTMCSSFLPYSPQTQSNSVLSGKAEVSLRNGHHAESWKSSKQQSLNERSEKIKVMLTTKTFSS